LTVTATPSAATVRHARGRTLTGRRPKPVRDLDWLSGLAALPATSERVLTAWLHDRPVAVLALERSHGPAGMRRLGLAGSSWLATDHTDVVRHRRVGRLQQALIDHLRTRSGWDCLEVDACAGRALAAALDQLRGHGSAISNRWTCFARMSSSPAAKAPKADSATTCALSSAVAVVRGAARRGHRRDHHPRAGAKRRWAPDGPAQRPLRTALPRLQHAERRRFHHQYPANWPGAGWPGWYRLNDGSRDRSVPVCLQFRDSRYYYSMGLRTTAAEAQAHLAGQRHPRAAQDGLTEFDLLARGSRLQGSFWPLMFAATSVVALCESPRSGARAAAHLLRRRLSREGIS